MSSHKRTTTLPVSANYGYLETSQTWCERARAMDTSSCFGDRLNRILVKRLGRSGATASFFKRRFTDIMTTVSMLMPYSDPCFDVFFRPRLV